MEIETTYAKVFKKKKKKSKEKPKNYQISTSTQRCSKFANPFNKTTVVIL